MLKRGLLVGLIVSAVTAMGVSGALADEGTAAPEGNGRVRGSAKKVEKAVGAEGSAGRGQGGTGSTPHVAAAAAASAPVVVGGGVVFSEESWAYTRQFLPECNGLAGVVEEWCAWVDPEPGPDSGVVGSGSGVSREGVEAVVREVVAGVQLPVGVPQVGPDPSWNEWGMAVVGLPLWLWVDGERSVSTSVSGFGLSVRLDARVAHTEFDMGDGGVVSCAQMKVYERSVVVPGTPSPVCGYTYGVAPERVGGERGHYVVSASSLWNVEWSAGGYSGVLPVTRTASRELPVGELHTVLVHP